MDIRHKYLRVSLQGHTDNPKDDPGWKIYPPPPPPVWVEDGTQRPSTANEEGASSIEKPSSSGKEGRKQGLDIGEDFLFGECEIPVEDEMEFRLDDQGVYQVYENKTGGFFNFTTIIYGRVYRLNTQ